MLALSGSRSARGAFYKGKNRLVDLFRLIVPLTEEDGREEAVNELATTVEQAIPLLLKEGWLRHPKNKCEATFEGRRRGGKT